MLSSVLFAVDAVRTTIENRLRRIDGRRVGRAL
jgi:hypothetical protein